MNIVRPRSISRAARLAIPAAFLAALALAVGSARSGASGFAGTEGPPQRNNDGAASLYWGAQIGRQITGEQPPWDMKALYKFENLTRKKVSLLSFQAPFAKCSSSHCSFYSFPTEPMESLRAHGVIPFFSWSSSSVSEGTTDPRFRLTKVIHGKYDAFIREFAETARDWGHPFFLRFNWEMNGNWFPWSEGVNGNKKGEFVAAWRHVHDIFTSVGATNATWVWCPNVGARENLGAMYPGNRYVDWTCLDGYNWGTRFSWSRWQSFTSIFADSYRKVIKLAPSKPMVLGEVASTSYGGSKPNWLKDMLKAVRTRFGKVRGMIYFDVPDRGTKWPIESPRKVTNAFAAGIANSAYRPNLFGDISASPIAPPTR